MLSSIFLGWEPREIPAYAVAKYSIRKRVGYGVHIRGLILQSLIKTGFYKRPFEFRNNQMWDTISDAPMATEFACSRFLTPIISRMSPQRESEEFGRWDMFMDCDMIVRRDINLALQPILDPSKAIYVVKHNHAPKSDIKMDGQAQTFYKRKNWSSVMVFNTFHPSNDKLTTELVNSVPGRDLHSFCWLDDDEIGELPPEFNYLVGHHNSKDIPNPAIVHHTEGSPCLKGYENVEYADEWKELLHEWAK